MRVISKDRLGRRDENTAQDAPGATVVTWVTLQVPPISRLAYRERKRSCLSVLETFRGDEDGVDAAVPVDAKNAPTSGLGKLQRAQFSTASTPITFSWKKKRRTKNE